MSSKTFVCFLSRKTKRGVAAAILSLVLIASMLPIQAFAVTSDELEQQAQEVINKLNDIQTQINETQEAYDNAVAAYDAANEAMEEAQKRIDEAQIEIDEIQDRLSDRVVAMYRSGGLSLLDVILGSNSFSDFVTATNMILTVNEYDTDLVAELRAARNEAKAANEEYAYQSQEAEAQMQASQEAQEELSAQAAEMQAEIANITEEMAELQAAEDAAFLTGYSATNDVIVGSGLFANPCPGASYISSEFGYRTYDNSFHKGLDFAASTGTPIYAAEAGTVIISGYSSSAGYWVVISHGNGLVTKYMHMATQPYVSAGQTVTKGQNIGPVGSTGNSSGPHLHFQVELNGQAVNPRYYL